MMRLNSFWTLSDHPATELVLLLVIHTAFYITGALLCHPEPKMKTAGRAGCFFFFALGLPGSLAN
ncbi:MAG: hypothetical protein R3175_06205 [Marinobacter sp.]|uniref:hypothetical protein n=1 Tax=Marinobacter sp. TaxID=50741 RepID=UPI00299EFC4F|nr:hypothetical protein [Marinobacter sp.]MDX1755632.1 hypothetical protein [Marinobacter sp.]